MDLSDIQGLGKKEETLKEAGIDSIEKLANASLDDLVKLKGIGKTSAEKYIATAKELLEGSTKNSSKEIAKEEKEPNLEEKLQKEIDDEVKKLEEKKKKLQGKKVEDGDFILLSITARTQKGKIFRVSSEEDAKKAGIYEEEKVKQGYYTPEFVIVGKPGFLNEGLTETLKEMEYFVKKSVRIPPQKAFGKRDPQKIERIGIAKYRKLNEGKNPEFGQEFTNKKGQRGTVTNIMQGKVIVDYNHPLAGQSIDYNLEVIDKIETFDEKIEYFMFSKGIQKDNIKEFEIKKGKDNDLEIIIPKMFLFQNLTYFKFGLATDLQTHLSDEVGNIKFIEIYEKMPLPPSPMDSVQQKIENFEKEHEDKHD